MDSRQLHCVRVAVDDDQLGRRQCLEHLNTDVAQPACADDDGLVARSEPPAAFAAAW